MARQNFSQSALEAEVEQALNETLDPLFPVHFLCMTQKLEKTNKTSIVVECCHASRIDFRRKSWTRKGFQESPQNSASEKFYLTSKSEFRISYFENRSDKSNPRLYHLHFHKKRENVLCFEADVKAKSSQCITARVEIHLGDTKETDLIENNSYMTHFDVTLIQNMIERAVTKASIPKSSKSRPSSDKRPPTTNGVKPLQQMSAYEKLQASLDSALKNIDPVDLSSVSTENKADDKNVEEENTVYFNLKTSFDSGNVS